MPGCDDTDAAPEARCWCHAWRREKAWRFARKMILCPDCGNKRCPKANNHGNVCTGSNAPGQPGSAYA
jgi:hypothetical protein